MAWLIGIPLFLVLVVISVGLLFSLAKTLLGFNGVRAMLELYWVIFLIIVWIAICVGVLAAVGFVLGPMIEYFVERDSKGGALLPAITIGLGMMGIMSAPVAATMVTSSLVRARES